MFIFFYVYGINFLWSTGTDLTDFTASPVDPYLNFLFFVWIIYCNKLPDNMWQSSLQKIKFAQLIKVFLTHHETRIFIAVFTRALHLMFMDPCIIA
jgi:hypothetical protein